MSSSTLMDTDLRESRKLADLAAQLIARFSPPLHPEEVRRCLIDCAANYESARVRSYLPMLIERDATTRLRRLGRKGPT